MITLDNIIMLTQKLIECKSFCQKNVNAAMDFAAETLISWGLHTKIITNQGYKMIVTEVGQGDRTIILNGHLDVVQGKPEQYSPQVRDGRIIGRGAYDMLGAAATMMDVMKELNLAEQQGNRLGIKVMLMLVPTEETNGMIGTGYLMEQGYTGDFVICGEPTNLNVSVMSKGVIHLRVTVTGKSAHSSKPWLGENAVIKAMRIYEQILTLPAFHEKNEFFPGPSLNLGKFYGGDAINKVPDFATMELDIRYLPPQTPEEIIRQIGTLDSTMTVVVIQTGVPVVVDPHSEYVANLMMNAHDNSILSEIIFQHGTADTRFFQTAGIPSVEFGPRGANHHSENEYVEIDSLKSYKKILLNFLGNLLSNAKKGGSDI